MDAIALVALFPVRLELFFYTAALQKVNFYLIPL